MNYENLVDLIVNEVMKRINSEEIGKSNEEKIVVFNNDDLIKYKNFFGPDKEVILFNENIRDCSGIIIGTLCLKGIGNLANLICSTKEENFIIKMLMKGKKIYISEDGLLFKRYKNTAPKQVYNKYLDFYNTLKNYGVEFFGGSPVVSTVSTEIKAISLHKKLITEADIRKQYLGGSKEVFINSKSVITPLAMDYIKMNHIQIKRVEG